MPITIIKNNAGTYLPSFDSDLEKINLELHSSNVPEPSFTVSFEKSSLIRRTALLFAKTLFFPLYLPYLALKKAATFCLLPSTVLHKKSQREELLSHHWCAKEQGVLAQHLHHVKELHEDVKKAPYWKKPSLFFAWMRANHAFKKEQKNTPLLKRFSVDVDGTPIDAHLMCRKNTLKSDLFVLEALPNAVCYETGCCGQLLAEKLKANYVVFNYPGVMCSKGSPSPKMMEKAYKALVLTMREGFGAKRFVHYGLSMGGAAQALGMDGFAPAKGELHICIKDRTFSSLGEAAKGVMGPVFGPLAKLAVKFTGWDIQSAVFSRRLHGEIEEIIIQSGHNAKTTAGPSSHNLVDMNNQNEIQGDGLITKHASLGWALSTPLIPTNTGKKHYMVAQVGHCDPFLNWSDLASKINHILVKRSSWFKSWD